MEAYVTACARGVSRAVQPGRLLLLFDRLTEGFAGAPAILFGDRTYTYGGVAHAPPRALRGHFAARGVTREQRVLIVLPDSPAFAVAFFATLHHGAVVAMGNPDAPVGDLAWLIEYVGPRRW